jgi:hypothetical protein
MATNTSNPVTVSQGGTGVSSATAYAVLCGGTTSTGALQSIAGVGSSGQVLTSNGAGALPTFQAAPSSGALTLVSTQTASSSANIAFTSIGSYTIYLLIFEDVIPATNNATLNGQISTNNGSTWITTNYQCGVNTFPYNSASFTNLNSTSNFLFSNALDNSNSAHFANGSVWLYNMNTVSVNMHLSGTGSCYGTVAAAHTGVIIMGSNPSNTNVNAINLLMSSGNISGGTFKLYGLQNS